MKIQGFNILTKLAERNGKFSFEFLPLLAAGRSQDSTLLKFEKTNETNNYSKHSNKAFSTPPNKFVLLCEAALRCEARKGAPQASLVIQMSIKT